MSSFWDKLPRPIFALAPLANVTDAVFREHVARYGKPDVFYTEFVSADGLCSKGREILLRDLRFTENQRPIVAQFFGATPEHFYECAQLAAKLGFDGVDINMGCPDGAVLRQGAGAALIKTPKLAREIIAATKSGAGGLPVSVKTRIGYGKIEIDTWIPELLKDGIAALAVHLRTMKEMSKVPAHWEALGKIAEMAKSTGTLVLGNGDALTIEDGMRRVGETGSDGIMFGRAIFGNPWLFARTEAIRSGHMSVVPRERMPEEKIGAFLELADLFQSVWGQSKDFNILKKHLKAYVSGFSGAGELRAKLMDAENAEKMRELLSASGFSEGNKMSYNEANENSKGQSRVF